MWGEFFNMRIVIYDANIKDAVSVTWTVGGKIYPVLRRCDVAVPVKSWAEVCPALMSLAEKHPITQVQFWGHGWFGKAAIGDDVLNTSTLRNTAFGAELRALGEKLAPGAIWWFRTCATYGAPAGKHFAEQFTNCLNRTTAGSTYSIGLIHSGIRTLLPYQKPYWSDREGVDFLPGENSERSGGKALLPTFSAPNTLMFWRNKIPESFFVNV